MIDNNRIFVSIPYESRSYIKLINGYQWHKNIKMWSVPLSAKERLFGFFPKLRKDIEKELIAVKNILTNQKMKRKAEYDNLIIDKRLFKRRPYDHQVDMIQRCIVEKQFALLCEMGTGKTQAVINTFEVLYLTQKVKTCLVIMPKTILENWEEEIDLNSNFSYIKLTGTKKQRLDKLANDKNFYLINYEGILVLKDYIEVAKFDMVVLDESSKIKNQKAKRSKTIIKLFKETPYKYIMTGTPITQSPLDIFTQFKFLNVNFFGYKSFYSFRNYYVEMGGFGGYEIMGYHHLDELKERISEHSIQLKKEDCLDLPEKIYIRRLLDMSDETRKQYNQMADELFIQISEDTALTAPIILTKILRLQQILSGAWITGKNPKLEELLTLIEESERVVVWFRFLESMKVITAGINKPYSIIYGEITNRQEQINNFRSGNTNVFLGQIQTAGLGVNLTPTDENAPATTVIYYENNFSLQDRLQSEDRVHRHGIHKPVTYVDLLYRGTMDTNVMTSIKDKQDIAKQLVECFKGGKYK